LGRLWKKRPKARFSFKAKAAFPKPEKVLGKAARFKTAGYWNRFKL
jgi:energy-converting hydrogenase Eha subunit A